MPKSTQRRKPFDAKNSIHHPYLRLLHIFYTEKYHAHILLIPAKAGNRLKLRCGQNGKTWHGPCWYHAGFRA
jgi:hypothetical protein